MKRREFIKQMINLTVIVSLLSMRTQASFIKCAPPRSVEAAYKQATSVFLGEVIAEEERAQPNPRSQFIAQVYRFKVEQWWKGGEKEEVEVYVSKTQRPDGKYGFNPEQKTFQKGKQYLVYGFSYENTIFAYGCTRTREVYKAQEDLQFLGKGQPPRKSSLEH